MRKLLIVIDMQKDFIDGALGTKEAVAIVPKVIEKIKAYPKEDILLTADTHYEDYLETQEGQNLPVKHCIKGTEGWEIQSDIKALVGNAPVFEKNTFGSKDLALYISKIDEPIEIELVGLCTDICVISNALLIKAFMPEVKISVDKSCCAGVTPTSHENAISAMTTCQIKIEG